MFISKKIKDLKKSLDIDMQLIAAELDTSVKSMKYISRALITDVYFIEAFDKLIEDIESNSEITSFDDNTILYEYLDEAVVIHNLLSDKYILFDNMITSKIENKLISYKR